MKSYHYPTSKCQATRSLSPIAKKEHTLNYEKSVTLLKETYSRKLSVYLLSFYEYIN